MNKSTWIKNQQKKIKTFDSVTCNQDALILFTTLKYWCDKKKSISGSKLFVKPWDKTTKNIFYDYNQFEKIPPSDDFASESQSEVA